MPRSTPIISTERRLIDRNDVSRPPRTITVEEAARLLGISRSTAYECVKSGEIPSIRFRRRIVIVSSAVDAMLGGS
jgi:excisionase family DNA binding protein